ncbi:MAG: class I SAM-dependent methyltransferase, partial [Planctomycetes bacterium]|nr:class I SAM-dependent methyltransferase [Planctomycetota bacterium]
MVQTEQHEPPSLTLSGDTPFELGPTSRDGDGRRASMHPRFAGRPTLHVAATGSLRFAPFAVPAEPRCVLDVHAEPAVDDRPPCTVWFHDVDGTCVQVDAPDAAERPWLDEWTRLAPDFTPLAGRTGHVEIRGHGGDGEFELLEFVLAPAATFSLAKARAFFDYRAANELAVFASTYDHEHYNQDRAARPSLWQRLRERLRRARQPAEAPAKPNLQQYYSSRLMQGLGIEHLSFHERLRRRLETADRPVRILSLASGAARIEADITAGVDRDRFELELTDLNPGLLVKAAARLPAGTNVRTRVLDLNRTELPLHSYDVVLCVSAIHHVVELEHLTAQIAGALRDDGEFWSIGEYVGGNGSTLPPRDYQVANEVFRALPAAFRVNRNPGAGEAVDQDLPNNDCSLTCFEGIRSVEIEQVYASRFEPLQVNRMDCFLWRLFNMTYLDNYDLRRDQDRELVDRAIEAEIAHFRAGGHPASL